MEISDKLIFEPLVLERIIDNIELICSLFCIFECMYMCIIICIHICKNIFLVSQGGSNTRSKTSFRD